MARSPIDILVDQATGFQPGMVAVKKIEVSCKKCGRHIVTLPCREDPKGTVKIVTSVCPKCGLEDYYIEYFFDVNGNQICEKVFSKDD